MFSVLLSWMIIKTFYNVLICSDKSFYQCIGTLVIKSIIIHLYKCGQVV